MNEHEPANAWMTVADSIAANKAALAALKEIAENPNEDPLARISAAVEILNRFSVSAR